MLSPRCSKRSYASRFLASTWENGQGRRQQRSARTPALSRHPHLFLRRTHTEPADYQMWCHKPRDRAANRRNEDFLPLLWKSTQGQWQSHRTTWTGQEEEEEPAVWNACNVGPQIILCYHYINNVWLQLKWKNNFTYVSYYSLPASSFNGKLKQFASFF